MTNLKDLDLGKNNCFVCSRWVFPNHHHLLDRSAQPCSLRFLTAAEGTNAITSIPSDIGLLTSLEALWLGEFTNSVAGAA